MTAAEDRSRAQRALANGAENLSTPDQPTSSTPISFPPPPNSHLPPPLSSSPSSAGSKANALTRALNLASKKLFGSGARSSPHYREYTSQSPRKQQFLTSRAGLGLDVHGHSIDPMEDEILAALEELAQKTDVLTHWADEMYEYVKAVPQSKLYLSSTCLLCLQV